MFSRSTYAALIVATTLVMKPTLSQAFEVQEDNGASTMTTEVLRLETGKPESCTKFKDLVAKHRLSGYDDANLKSLEDLFCIASKDGKTSVVYLTLVQDGEENGDAKTEPKKEEDKTESGTELTGTANVDFSGGNRNFFRAEGELEGKFVTGKFSSIESTGEFAYESDSDVARANLSATYVVVKGEHFKIFLSEHIEKDHERQLALGNTNIAGVIYSVFPFDQMEKKYLAFSAGVGNRFDKLEAGNINNAILSLRMKAAKELTPYLHVMTSLWFQHSLYGQRAPGDQNRVFDIQNYRVFNEINVTWGSPDALQMVAGVENSYWNFQNIGTKRFDTRMKIGFQYKLVGRKKKSTISAN